MKTPLNSFTSGCFSFDSMWNGIIEKQDVMGMLTMIQNITSHSNNRKSLQAIVLQSKKAGLLKSSGMFILWMPMEITGSQAFPSPKPNW